MSTLATAIRIAAEVHERQRDKGGAPYVLHPLRMMLRLEGEAERIVAVLHDVVEDGGGSWSFERLRAEGFSEEILVALEHVTKRPEEVGDYDAFIRRAARNPIARRVKLADLEDNMDLRRIPHPAPRDFERLAKYRRAWDLLGGTSGG